MVRSILLDWVRLIRSNERYYFAKAMGLFYQMPLAYQRSLIEFLADKEGMERWANKVDDNTQYPDVIRSILFYYSGRKDLDQPYKEQFLARIGEFVKSDEFSGAKESADATSFVDELDRL